MRHALIVAAVLGLSACATDGTADSAARVVAAPQAQDSYFKAGQARAAAAPSGERARNLIVFIGDGMGVTTVTAARIYAGQIAGRDGESNTLAMDLFPHTALARTYSHDMQIAESAATATAIVSGVKTRAGGVGVTQGSMLNDCALAAANVSRSLFAFAEDAGLATGVVSTARLTHATPAAAYAHTPNRNWENDALVARGGGNCPDIARQLIEWPHGDGLEIAFGGGIEHFLPANPGGRGQRADGRDLTGEWRRKPGRLFIERADQLAEIGDRQALGLFSADHMSYERDRARGPSTEPSLKDMTAAAIRRLARDPDGYVLMVEGGRIDHAHHDGRAGEALAETVAMDEAIAVALEMTRREDTLIVVTADHGHTLAMAGYSRRGAPILGLSTTPSGQPAAAADGKPYTTLGYANGPGAVPAGAPRPALTDTEVQAPTFRQQALVPLPSETHGGEDVAVYAWGPADENFSGTLEQHALFHLAARALGFTFR